MKKIELLAPAGSKEAFFAAINNGADAIYMGGLNYSARAFANNFKEEEIEELVKYAHLRNVKIYLTVNTLINDDEFKELKRVIKKYYDYKVDALIIQDLGLYYWLKNTYPDFEIHASTQMHIHNISGVRVAKKLGFKRVVLARESSLNLIQEACKEDIEIETFIHGAICVSYSGQCLLSSASKNRSANKGMCAQCCRMKYALKDSNNNIINTDTDYLLSPKDMFLLEDIPDLIKAGVTSLKIEGRMKSSAYVGYITRTYRKAIDDYYNSLEYKLNNDTLDNMKVLFNRGFTNTYLKNDDNNLFGQLWPNHQGLLIGRVIKSNGKRVMIKLNHELHQFDGVRISSKYFDDGFIVNKLYVNNKLVAKAFKNEVIELESSYNFKYGDSLLLTQDYLFEEEINNVDNKYLPLDLDINIYPNKNIEIDAKCLNTNYHFISNVKADNALNAPLNEESIKKQFSKLKETPYYLNKCLIHTEKAFLRVSELNSIRNELIDELNKYRYNLFKRDVLNADIIFRDNFESNINELVQKDKYLNDYYINDVINLNSIYHLNKEVITEIGGLLNNSDKIGYYTLNIYNSYAYEFLKKIGFKEIVLSTELNEANILFLIKEYKIRNNVLIKPFVLIDGKRSLMYLRRNPFKTYENYKYLQSNDIKLIIKENKDYLELIESNNHKLDIDEKLIRKLFIVD